jgi:hypothetical protein
MTEQRDERPPDEAAEEGSELERTVRRALGAYGLGFLSVVVFGALWVTGVQWATVSAYEMLTLTSWLVSITGFAFGPALYGRRAARTQ